MADIDNTYHNLIEEILNKGYTYEDPNRKGVNRIQISSYQFYHSFSDGFPAITTKKLYWRGVVGELLWFLRGDTNIKYLVDNGINIWNKDAYNYYLKIPQEHVEKYSFEDFIKTIKLNDFSNLKATNKIGNYILGDLGRVYGAQWRNWTKVEENIHTMKYYKSTVDQISNLIEELKENPMGTRHIVTAWNPAELDSMALPPCHWSFEILVEPLGDKQISNKALKLAIDANKNGRRSADITWAFTQAPKYQFTLKWHQRSVDTFLGLPFNIASYALLAHIIGKITNMVPKGIIGDLSNVHIYESHLDAVKEQLNRDVNKHGKSDLNVDMLDRVNLDKSVDHIVSMAQISDFELLNYTAYPTIKAEMLAYNK